jgi:hypothetical protein
MSNNFLLLVTNKGLPEETQLVSRIIPARNPPFHITPIGNAHIFKPHQWILANWLGSYDVANVKALLASCSFGTWNWSMCASCSFGTWNWSAAGLGATGGTCANRRHRR